jgi:Ca2+-transporting ATPase
MFQAQHSQASTLTGWGLCFAVDLLQHAAPLLELATLLLGCNNAHLVQEKGMWRVVGDPTEGAQLAAGRKAGGDSERIEKEIQKQNEFPFDSDRIRSTEFVQCRGRFRAFTNGAPGVHLQLCTQLYTRTGIRPLTHQDRENVRAQTTAMAKQALRVLGSAYRDMDNLSPSDLTADAVEHDLVFVGLSGMYDPPRQEAKEVVAKCHAAGIRVVMITGNHPETAVAIARELGIASTADDCLRHRRSSDAAPTYSPALDQSRH